MVLKRSLLFSQDAATSPSPRAAESSPVHPFKSSVLDPFEYYPEIYSYIC